MQPRVLLHLIEPAGWRAALADGAVRPPSLESAGFLHLSTPEQVHLPAERLHPGRRDLVVLVVDPARLMDPVRFEDGVPADPGGLRFPHLYGALPVTAVIAVVPYRPPAPLILPAPDDRFGRALTLSTSVQIRRAVGVGNVPGGAAVLDPDFPASRDNNRLILSAPVDAATVERSVDEVAGNAGWPHRTAALTWPGAGRVAAELAGRGWTAQEFRLMARATAPTPARSQVEMIVARAVDLAAAQGCDLLVLEAVAEDRPRDWYGRRGFDVVGSVWEVLRPA